MSSTTIDSADGFFRENFIAIRQDSRVTYLLHVTTNLAAPISWETIATNMATTGGTIEFVDPVATNIHTRYYRPVMPLGWPWQSNSHCIV
jgi:hypothetical protein